MSVIDDGAVFGGFIRLRCDYVIALLDAVCTGPDKLSVCDLSKHVQVMRCLRENDIDFLPMLDLSFRNGSSYVKGWKIILRTLGEHFHDEPNTGDRIGITHKLVHDKLPDLRLSLYLRLEKADVFRNSHVSCLPPVLTNWLRERVDPPVHAPEAQSENAGEEAAALVAENCTDHTAPSGTQEFQ